MTGSLIGGKGNNNYSFSVVLTNLNEMVKPESSKMFVLLLIFNIFFSNKEVINIFQAYLVGKKRINGSLVGGRFNFPII